MGFWTILLAAVALLAVPAALYGLHRLCLWLEQKGRLYYLHKKPNSSPLGCFVAFQKIIEPQAQHVIEVKEEKGQDTAEKAPGDVMEND